MWSITSDYPDFRQSKHIYVGESRIATKLNIEGDGSVGYEEINTYYYHTDHLGSAQLVTDYEGGIYEHIEYTPYGELWIEEKSDSFDKIPFRFTGKEMDEETGFVYFGARYLSPRMGRWLSVDPALEQYLPVPGNDRESRSRNSRLPNAGIFNHFNLSPYVYSNNNPVSYVDPNGEIVIAAAVTALASYISAIAASPDLEYDIMSFSDNIANQDYVSAVFDVVGMLIPGISNTDEVYKGAKKLVGEYGDDIGKWASKSLQELGAELHHIFTNKAIKSQFTDKFDDILKGAGMTFKDPEVLIPLLGHKGRHTKKYWKSLLDRCNDALEGLKEGTIEYTNALKEFLENEAKALIENPGILKEK